MKYSMASPLMLGWQKWMVEKRRAYRTDTTTHDHKEGRSQFPTGLRALDGLVENETYLDIFEQCLGDRPAYRNAQIAFCARDLLTNAMPSIRGRGIT